MRSPDGRRSLLKAFAGLSPHALCLMAVLALALAPAACSRSRTVYIPPEWKAPPGQQGQASQPGPGGPSSNETGPSTGPVIKAGPGFKESDLPSGREPAVAPGATKKVQPTTPEQQPPQRLASMHLVDQGKASLSQGKPDAAIPLFEQAVQVDVHNGEAFFGLAKAWRMKGSRNKAQEFARKAEILFQDNPEKLKEVWLFLADLFKELGDTNKMESYREKASKL
ncbi:MAG: tetratricopeptide repeat protein [Syntrophobacteraceae bacterium]